jgi:alkylated DNA nucleotide flippase Atl1
MSIVDDVRDVVTAIPAGFVASYGDIGKRIGAGPRQVGRAMSLLDDSVPRWRVVYANGTPASCHSGRAAGLLNDEGTLMLGVRVDMKRASAARCRSLRSELLARRVARSHRLVAYGVSSLRAGAK